jgi:hypothetical protein
MNGTMARLLGLLAVASTLILGGCVAETGDEEQESVAAELGHRAELGGPVELGRPAVTSRPGAASSVASPETKGASLPQALVPQTATPAPLDVMVEDENDNNGDDKQDPIPTPWMGPIGPHR